MAKRQVGIDYESWLISSETPVPKPVCLSYCDGPSSGLLVGFDDMRSYLKDLLENPEVEIVAHNATFELLVTHKYFPELKPLLWKSLDEGRWYCTQLYQQLIGNVSKTELTNMSLAGLVKHYFKEDISESKTDPNAWRLRYSELDGVPLSEWPEEAKKYAIDDSIWAIKVRKAQQEHKKGLLFAQHVGSGFALNLMPASRGMLVDKDRVNTLDEEITNILQPAYEKLLSQGLMNKDKNGKLSKNIKGLQEYIQNKYKTILYTAAGKVAVSREALEKYLTEQGDENLLTFLSLSEYEKVKTTYISRLKQADPYIRTSYNAIVRSGRTSSRASSVYPSVNIQNQPRGIKNVTWDIRNCYIPRPGFKLFAIDYNNLELLAVANQLFEIYGRCKMLDLINSGDVPVDLHSVFAHNLMSKSTKTNVTYQEYMDNKKDKRYKQYRDKGKPVTLGVPGGMGYDTIKLQFIKAGVPLIYEELHTMNSEYHARRICRKLSEEYADLRVKRTGYREYTIVKDEIVGLKQILFDLYPELQEFLKTGHEKYMTTETKWTKNEFGEWEEEPYYKYVAQGVRRDYCTYTAMCNGFLMQSPSAAGAKNVAYKLMKHFDDSNDVFLQAFIHDEFVGEVRDDENLEANIRQVEEIMIDGMQEILKHCRVAIESSVMDYWSKDVALWSRVAFKNAGGGTLLYK